MTGRRRRAGEQEADSRRQEAGGRRHEEGRGDTATRRGGEGGQGSTGERELRRTGEPGKRGPGEGETGGGGAEEHRRADEQRETEQQPRITPGGPGFPTLPGAQAATACPPGPSRRHAGPHRRWSGMPGNCGIDSSLRWRGEAAGSPVISSCTYPMARYARRRRSNIFSNTGTARST